MAQHVNAEAMLAQMVHTQQQIADVLGAMQQNTAGGGNSSGLKPQLPTFEGKRGVDNVRKFRAQIETACDATNTRADRRVAIAAAQLRGAASEWWYSLIQVEGRDFAQFLSIDEFFRRLEENFMPQNYLDYVYGELEACKQKGDIYEYINRFSNLANQLYGLVNDFVLIKQFTKGLKPQTQYQVIARNPTTLQEAFNVATHYDSAFMTVNMEMRKHRQQPNRQFTTLYNRQTTQQPKTGPTPMEMDALRMRQQQQFNNGQKPKDLTDVQCYGCKEMGHYAYNCPKKTKVRANEVELQQDDHSDIERGNDLDYGSDPSGNDGLPFM